VTVPTIEPYNTWASSPGAAKNAANSAAIPINALNERRVNVQNIERSITKSLLGKTLP
jgi:hypothetical protein